MLGEERTGSKMPLALIIVCLVLAAGLVGEYYYFTTVVGEKDAEIRSLEQQVSQLNAQLADRDQQIQDLNSQLSEKSQQIQSLLDEKNQLQQQLAEKESRIAELQSQIDQLNSKIKEKDNMIVSLSMQITDLKNQLTARDNKIASLQDQVDSLTATLNQKEAAIASLKAQIADLQDQISELNSIIRLEKNETWLSYYNLNQPAGGYTAWGFTAEYAGYLVVIVHSSSTSKTYVRVQWSAYGINYDETIEVGTSGVAIFPVLPTSNGRIIVGNNNLLNPASMTISIIYNY